MADEDLVTSLRQAGVNRGDLVGLVISPALDLGLATADRSWPTAAGAGLADEVGRRMRRCGLGGRCGRGRRRRG